MYLQDKETYREMMGEFDSFLQKANISLKFRQRDLMIAKLIFNKTPNEIHQHLSRGEHVPVNWMAGDPRMLSIWPRIKLVMNETGLNDYQLKSMVSGILAKVFHKLEQTMQSAIFQASLGMKLFPLDGGLNDRIMNNKGKMLNMDRYHFPKFSYMQHVFYDAHYEPSSTPRQYTPFDNDTYEIILSAYTSAISSAEEKAILSVSEVSLLEKDLGSLRNYHLAALLLQPNKNLIKRIQSYLSEYVESYIQDYETLQYEEDSLLYHWWEDVELETSPLWYSMAMSMTMKVVPDYLVEEVLKETDNRGLFYKTNIELHEFNTLFTRHLEDIGMIIHRISQGDDGIVDFVPDVYYDIWNDKETKSFSEAIEIAYVGAYEEYRDLVMRQVRLLTRVDNDHLIYSLIPTVPNKD